MQRTEANTVYRGDLTKLLRKVEGERGIDLGQYRRPYLERRIATRLRSLNLSTYRQYSRLLEKDPEEFGRLIDALTINVTDFFRDPTVWEFLRSEVLPAMYERKGGTQLVSRFWSAGCATGEEPYSIAMCVMSYLQKKGVKEPHFTVFASDLDPIALGKAREGVYDLARLKDIPVHDRLRFLDQTPDFFKVKPELSSHVRFSRLNLFADEPIKMVDVIFCRNVFIYFTREQQQKVSERFLDALQRGGYLVLGRSERLPPGLSGKLSLVSGKERVYRKPER